MMANKDPFQEVPEDKLPQMREVLKARLPLSGHVYNISMTLTLLKQASIPVTCYAWHGYLAQGSAIIMVIVDREDYGQDINFSIPPNFQATESLKKDLTSTTTIDWTGRHMFVAVDRALSITIFEISTSIYRNSVMFNPNYVYWMSPEKALEFNVEDDTSGVTVRPMKDAGSGAEAGVAFLLSTWKYVRPGAEEFLKKLVNHLGSCGVYNKDGDVLCGGVLQGHGLVGVVNTSPAEKRKGYASKCMKYLLKSMAEAGMAPVSSSQQENHHSVPFHESVGMVNIHDADYIIHIPLITPD